jgi:hypothetical protein
MANRYYVGGTSGAWNVTSSWSATSGGASGASVPTSADAVFFDANSGAGSIALPTTTIASLNTTNCPAKTFTGGTLTVSGIGNLILHTNVIWNATLTITNTGTGGSNPTVLTWTANISSTGIINCDSGSSATGVVLGANMDARNLYLNVTGGAFGTTYGLGASYNLDIWYFSAEGPTAKTIKLANGATGTNSTLTIWGYKAGGTTAQSWEFGYQVGLGAVTFSNGVPFLYFKQIQVSFYGGGVTSYGTVGIKTNGTAVFGLFDSGNRFYTIEYESDVAIGSIAGLISLNIQGGYNRIDQWSANATGGAGYSTFIMGAIETVNPGGSRLDIRNMPSNIDYVSVTDNWVFGNPDTPNVVQCYWGPNSRWTDNIISQGNTTGAVLAAKQQYQVIEYLTVGSGSWTCPSGYINTANNAIYIYGAGGGSSGGSINTANNNRVAGSGGGGGGFAQIINPTLNAGSSYSYGVGAKGAGASGNITASASTGGNGGNSYFTVAGVTYTAGGGLGGVSNSGTMTATAGAGGSSSLGSGYQGGSGGTGRMVSGALTACGGGGGGGCANSLGFGNNGASATNTAGGAGGSNGGGSAIPNNTTALGQNGGNNADGVGGGTVGQQDAFNGGGGASGDASASRVDGAWGGTGNSEAGWAGGGGASGASGRLSAGSPFNDTGNGSPAKAYGGGGGGGSVGQGNTIDDVGDGGAGGDGLIVISYFTAIPPSQTTGNFFLVM